MSKTTHFKVKIYIWPLHLCKQKAEMLMPEEE